MADIRYKTYEEVFTFENLLDAFKKCMKGVSWKSSVQNFFIHGISNIHKLFLELHSGKRVKTGRFFKFTIMERGKVRHIKSVKIRERIIQRCFCDYYLVPLLTRKFIYDNSACVKGKGMHFALKRIKRYLHHYYQKTGKNDLYILQFDFHHYFDTIPHQGVIDAVCAEMRDGKLKALYAQLVNDFDGEEGLGLGSQISQISALFYPHEIDNAFTYMDDIEGYARYMDDGYILSPSKEKLKECMKMLEEKVKELDLQLNEKKTVIHKVSKSFEFLKARISMLENGKIIMKPNRKNVTRNRRKLKKIYGMFLDGEITEKYMDNLFQTIVGNLKYFNAYHTVKNYAILYANLKGDKNGIHCRKSIR